MNETGAIMKAELNIIRLTEENFRKTVLESSEPILVEIGADWCGSCHIMAPIIEKLAGEYQGQIKIGKLDIDTNETVARTYGVNELPLLLFFKDGKLLDHIIGTVSQKVLQTRIQAFLKL
jgi:thioredoxin 1